MFHARSYLRSAFALILIFFSTFTSSLASDSKLHWLLVSSAHFSVLTDGDEKKANEVLLRFEQMRAIFAQLLQRNKLTMSEPLEIVAFNTREEYSEFTPSLDGRPISQSGFFLPGDDRNFVGLDLSDDENWRAISGSLARVYLNYNYPPAQAWFDEGLVEYFSSLRLSDTQSSLGSDPSSLVTQLASAPWLPLPELFDVHPDDDQESLPPIFAAESWIAMHYLLSKNELSETGTYMGLVEAKKVPVDQAVQQAFSMSVAQLEQSIKDYFHSVAPVLQAQTPITNEGKSPTSATARAHSPIHQFSAPLSPLDVGTSLRRLSDAEGQARAFELAVRIPERREQAVAQLQNLLAQPKGETAIAHRAIAWVHLQKQEYDQAFEDLSAAATLDRADPWTRYYLALAKYVQADQTGNPIQSIPNLMQDLHTVLDWDPDFAEAYNMLAMAQLQGGGIHAAADSLRPAIQLNPRSELYLLNLAKIYLEAKKWDEASTLLNLLKDSHDSDIAGAAQKDLQDLPMLKKYGVAPQSQTAASTSQPAVISNNTDDDPAADEADATPPAAPGPDMRKTEFLRGRLLSIDCSQPPIAIIRLSSGAKTMKLRTEDYRSLVVIGAGAFSCDWANLPVTVNYKAGGKANGDLVSLEIR